MRLAPLAIGSIVGFLSACGGGSGTDSQSTADSATTAPVGDVCDELELTRRAWDPSGDGTVTYKGLASDFTVKTLDGPWTLSKAWTGCENILVIRQNPRNSNGEDVWAGEDHEDFVRLLPENTIVVFIPDSPDPAGAVKDLRSKMNKAIKQLGPNKEAWWEQEGRFIYVKKNYNELDDWVDDYLSSPGWGFAVDRFQIVRDLGSLHDAERYNSSTGWFDDNFSHYAHASIFYNFESDRQDALDAQQDLLVIETWKDEVVESGWSGNDGYVTVTLPDASQMASYDSLTVEMDMTCGGAEYGTCPAWDRITTMFICNEPSEATNPYETTACQQYVPEVMGQCTFDGVADGSTCREIADCPTVPAVTTTTSATGTTTSTATTSTTPSYSIACDGFEAAIPADTVTCPCDDLMGDAGGPESSRTCNSDGTGYGECNCSCGTEFNRWITTYHREGRWANDAHHNLAWLRRGGDVTFRYSSIDPWTIDIDLRLHNQGLSEKVSETHYLFGGGSFGETYNDKYSPIELDIPASATKVELAVIISGHGMTSNGNCAEFCNTEHFWSVNDNVHEINFDYLDGPDSVEWCQNDVENGTVPNQYGTWFYARSNWCPGKEVAPIYIDITDDVVLGQTNTFEYWGFRNGSPFSDGSASISMSSFVTIHE